MILFENVSKQYPDGTMAVQDLSFECPNGEITVFVGPSGCGKTTSLRMINRSIDPTKGRITLNGEDIKSHKLTDLRRGIGYVIQSGGLFPHRTIVENIMTVPRLLGRPRNEAKARALELMELVGLNTKLAKRYPYQLSGGQQQRVGVARALAADPPVLLMDEPFAAVDPVVRAELQDEFLRLQREIGKTIVLVTHDIDEAIKLGDKIAVFREGGELMQLASPINLLASPASEFVRNFLGDGRGIRRLHFIDGNSVPTTDELVISEESSPTEALAQAAATGTDWLLLTAKNRTPRGWIHVGDIAGTGSLSSTLLHPVGSTFGADDTSLRTMLDLAILSPSNSVVIMGQDQRVQATACYSDITSAVFGKNEVKVS